MTSRPENLQQLLRLDLFEAGWEGSREYPGISHRQVAMNSLESSLLKKFHNDETDEIRDNKALALFLECNAKCQNYGVLEPRNLKEELVINEMKSIIYDFFNPSPGYNWDDELSKPSSLWEPFLLNLSSISSNFGVGSGSNIGVASTDFYSKLANSTLAHTNEVLPLLYRQAISSQMKLWADVEVFRSRYFKTEVVRGSRLSFVPKSRVISRTICTEPILNMLFQKGIGDVIHGRLREVFGLDFSIQPGKNAYLAQLGSETGKFGTIDLSSASDTISLSLLKQILPSEPLNWLLRCRCDRTILPDGTEIDLHMISSMGNGFTFPLQTMIFACLVTAVYRILGIKLSRPIRQAYGNFAVFGDDIIVDERAYSTVVDCLELLGFSVNRNKSFNEGLFRESCGSDFYFGHNVRGVYVQKLLTAGDFYSAINRLNRWSALHGIFLSRVIKFLRSGCRFSGVPFDESDDAGIKVPESLLRKIRRDRNGAIKYFALVNVSRRVDLSVLAEGSEVRVRGLSVIRMKLPNFQENPDALLFAFVAGYIRNSHIGLRSLKPKAVLRKRVCPGWDNRVFATGASQLFSERWKFFTEANLVS